MALADPLASLLTILIENRQLHQPAPDKHMVVRCSDPSHRRIWVTEPGKPTRLAEGLVEDKGNLEWMVEKRDDRY